MGSIIYDVYKVEVNEDHKILGNFTDVYGWFSGAWRWEIFLILWSFTRTKSKFLFSINCKVFLYFLAFKYYTVSFLKLLLQLLCISELETHMRYDSVWWKLSRLTSVRFPVSVVLLIRFVNGVCISKDISYYISTVILLLTFLRPFKNLCRGGQVSKPTKDVQSITGGYRSKLDGCGDGDSNFRFFLGTSWVNDQYIWPWKFLRESSKTEPVFRNLQICLKQTP